MLHALQQGSTADRLRHIIDGPFPAALRTILRRWKLFSGSVFASAINIVATLIHNEPTSLAVLQEAQLPDACLAVLTSGIPSDLHVPTRSAPLRRDLADPATPAAPRCPPLPCPGDLGAAQRVLGLLPQRRRAGPVPRREPVPPPAQVSLASESGRVAVGLTPSPASACWPIRRTCRR
jgi:hypothetical protein